jgi:hypothetical protein
MDRDRVLAKLARRQQEVFTRWRLVRIGFTDDAIDRRLSSERLHIVHRGVLSIVPRQLMTRPAFFMAAVLAGGEGAVLSPRSAAALWGLRQSASAVVDITVARRVGQRSGVRAHRVPLATDEHTVVDGIPVTTPPRTVFDLAGDLQPTSSGRALEQMEVVRLWDRLTLADLGASSRSSPTPRWPTWRLSSPPHLVLLHHPEADSQLHSPW